MKVIIHDLEPQYNDMIKAKCDCVTEQEPFICI